jgi:hypothetical protein
VGLANLGSESETCVGSRVRLVGVLISFEKNFCQLPSLPPSLVRRIGPSVCSRSHWVRGILPSVVSGDLLEAARSHPDLLAPDICSMFKIQ